MAQDTPPTSADTTDTTDAALLVPLLGDEQAEHDERLRGAVARHPAGRAGHGAHRVELAPERTVTVIRPSEDPAVSDRFIGIAVVPAVHAMECYTCAALLRPGPATAQHVRRHRDEAARARSRTWRGLLRRSRGALYRLTHRSTRKA